MGSGGWNSTGRPTTATALRLDVNVLRRRGCLSHGWSGSWAWTWSTGEKSSIDVAAHDHGVTLRFTVRINGSEPEFVVQHVPVEWRPCRFGGMRPFWRCPTCGRRIVVLYGRRTFTCRACSHLTYDSQRERGPDRAQRRANKIRVRLGGEAGWGQFPPKPPRMHQRTYDRLLDRVLVADAETDDYAELLLARIERAERGEPPSNRRSFWS